MVVRIREGVKSNKCFNYVDAEADEETKTPGAGPAPGVFHRVFHIKAEPGRVFGHCTWVWLLMWFMQ